MSGRRGLAPTLGPVLNLVQIKNGDLILSGYFTKNVFETSPDAVVTVSIAKPLRPPLGTVAEILLSLSILNMRRSAERQVLLRDAQHAIGGM